jgi:tRNA ligase
LCDDSFEEHVIATPTHWTGLHLHGLNHNIPHFSTVSPTEVESFAQEYGFIPTKYVKLDTLAEVKAFTDDVALSGSWEGEMIEGFVVRCTVANTETPILSGRPPYKP